MEVALFERAFLIFVAVYGVLAQVKLFKNGVLVNALIGHDAVRCVPIIVIAVQRKAKAKN